MHRRTIAAGLALVMLGMAVPTLAYHIDNAEPAGTLGGPSSNDFVIGSSFLIVCEREWGAGFGVGPAFVPADDRNPNEQKTAAGSHFGDGGLCTTGENDASGRPAPGYDDGAGPCGGGLPAAPPIGSGVAEPANAKCAAEAPAAQAFYPDDYTRLDACDVDTFTRNAGAFGPYPAGGLPCSGSTADHWWDFEMGVYVCTVPVSDPALGFPLENYAIYYDRLYAFFNYDGDGWYFHPVAPTWRGDTIGAAHSGDTPNLNNNLLWVNLGFDDISDAFQGHAAMFIDPSSSPATMSLIGSAETSPGSAGQNAAGVWVVNSARMAALPGTYDSDCDNSQGFTTGGTYAGVASNYGCAASQRDAGPDAVLGNGDDLCGPLGPPFAAPLGPIFRACWDAPAVALPGATTCID